MDVGYLAWHDNEIRTNGTLVGVFRTKNGTPLNVFRIGKISRRNSAQDTTLVK